jgi:hypothetical protein
VGRCFRGRADRDPAVGPDQVVPAGLGPATRPDPGAPARGSRGPIGAPVRDGGGLGDRIVGAAGRGNAQSGSLGHHGGPRAVVVGDPPVVVTPGRGGRAGVDAVLRRCRGWAALLRQGAGQGRAQRGSAVPRLPLPAPARRGRRGAVLLPPARRGARGDDLGVGRAGRGANPRHGGLHRARGRLDGAGLRPGEGPVDRRRRPRGADRRVPAGHVGAGADPARGADRPPRSAQRQRLHDRGRRTDDDRLRVRRGLGLRRAARPGRRPADPLHGHRRRRAAGGRRRGRGPRPRGRGRRCSSDAGAGRSRGQPRPRRVRTRACSTRPARRSRRRPGSTPSSWPSSNGPTPRRSSPP